MIMSAAHRGVKVNAFTFNSRGEGNENDALQKWEMNITCTKHNRRVEKFMNLH